MLTAFAGREDLLTDVRPDLPSASVSDPLRRDLDRRPRARRLNPRTRESLADDPLGPIRIDILVGLAARSRRTIHTTSTQRNGVAANAYDLVGHRVAGTVQILTTNEVSSDRLCMTDCTIGSIAILLQLLRIRSSVLGTARPMKFMSKLHRRQERAPRSSGHEPIDGRREKNERPER